MDIQDNNKITCYGFDLEDCEGAKAVFINKQKEAVLIKSSSKINRCTPNQLKGIGEAVFYIIENLSQEQFNYICKVVKDDVQYKYISDAIKNNAVKQIEYSNIKDKCNIYSVD